MIRLAHFGAVLMARNREFLRDRSSWAWNLIFPVLLIVGLAFVFGNDNAAVYKVGVYPDVTDDPFFSTRYVQFVEVEDLDDAIGRVDRHQYDLLLDTADARYWVNETSPKGYFAERVALLESDVTYERQPLTGSAVRYLDWVVPGVLGMNMMFACLFGVGYVIVRYRKSGVLKRLKATPLKSIEFITAQIVSRLWLVLAITVSVYVGTDWFLDFTMNGNYITLFLVLLLGAVCLISLGLLVASRTASEELAGGLLNVATWPMMLLSGVWFSMEGAHPVVRAVSQVLPLTHIIEAARTIMIDGASILSVSGHLVYLLVLTAIFLGLGARFFRWE